MQPLVIAGDDLGQDAPEKVVVVVPPPTSTRALKKDPVLRGP